jgi:hypothetical protein
VRNTIPLYLDMAIVAIAIASIIIRSFFMRTRQARWFTLLVTCFCAADLIKMGLVNDLLTGVLDARAVRVLAQIFTVAAAFVAFAAVRDAETTWEGQSRRAARRMIVRVAGCWCATSFLLIGIDLVAADRTGPIELASPGWSIFYFAVYAGAILCADGYALARVVAALRSHQRGERPPAALSLTTLAIFVTTGLNSVSLLWYAIASAAGRIGPAERLQRDSNGNLFAYFTLGITIVSIIGLINWFVRRRGEDSDLASAMRGLPIVWKRLVTQVPSVRLTPTSPLDRDEAVVRMVTECIDALVILHHAEDGTTGVAYSAIGPSEVLRLARAADPKRAVPSLEV